MNDYDSYMNVRVFLQMKMIFEGRVYTKKQYDELGSDINSSYDDHDHVIVYENDDRILFQYMG